MGDASEVVLDITISLDGFVARPDDDVSRLHEWLFSGDTPSGRNDFFRLSPESATTTSSSSRRGSSKPPG